MEKADCEKQGHVVSNSPSSLWLRSCTGEVRDPTDGTVTFGKLPIWLNGSIIQNGPGGVETYGENACKHVLDGPGLLQKFHIQSGKASYSSSFVQSRAFTKNLEARRLVVSEFGTAASPDPDQSIFARIAAALLGPFESTISDNANISIYPIGDEVYSLSEFPFAHRIDSDNLETINTVNVNKEFGIITHTAHPQRWGRRVYNLGQRFTLWNGPHYIITELHTASRINKNRRPSNSPGGGGSRSRSASVVTNATVNTSGASSIASSMTNLAVSVQQEIVDMTEPLASAFPSKYSFSPWSHAKIVATIPSRWPMSLCYMHTFSITQNYFVVIEQPLAIFLPSVPLTHISGSRPLASCLKFYPEEDTLFHVVSRYGRKSAVGRSNKPRKSFRSESFFYLHTINAFELRDDDGKETFVVVDICCYKDTGVLESMYVDILKEIQENSEITRMPLAYPHRFLLRLEDSSADKKGLQGIESEMLVKIGCESPTINQEYNGKPYNYLYAVSTDASKPNCTSLIKVDVLRKTHETWSEPNAHPSKPMFVPRPNSQREDDGVVLSTILYGGGDGESSEGSNTRKTTLVVLNASSWDLMAKVDFNVENTVPKCLHGWFFQDKNQTASNPNAKLQC